MRVETIAVDADAVADCDVVQGADVAAGVGVPRCWIVDRSRLAEPVERVGLIVNRVDNLDPGGQREFEVGAREPLLQLDRARAVLDSPRLDVVGRKRPPFVGATDTR